MEAAAIEGADKSIQMKKKTDTTFTPKIPDNISLLHRIGLELKYRCAHVLRGKHLSKQNRREGKMKIQQKKKK